MTTGTLYKPNFHRVEEDWKNQPAYVVAGGPSLIGFDFNKLKGKNVVAVKSAAYYLPWASAYFSMDIVNWNFASRLDSLKQVEFKGDIVIACNEYWQAPCPVDDVKFLIRDNGPGKCGISFQKDRVQGHNSGFSALNYTFLRGANPIYLLGFDFVEGGYWYDPENSRWKMPFTANGKSKTRKEYIEEMSSDFLMAADELWMYGVEVFNTGGSLKWFDMIKLEDL